jgi:hypothetical protein
MNSINTPSNSTHYYGPLVLDLVGTSITDVEIGLLSDARVGGVILFSRNFQNRINSIHSCRSSKHLIAQAVNRGRP